MIIIFFFQIIELPDFKKLILEDANEITNRQEVDTISVVDDIRYHIDNLQYNSERVYNCFQKHLLINKILANLGLEA